MAVGPETDGVGMPVLRTSPLNTVQGLVRKLRFARLCHRHEPAGDPDVGIAQLPETAVDRALAQEFIESVVRFVVTDEENPSDVLGQ